MEWDNRLHASKFSFFFCCSAIIVIENIKQTNSYKRYKAAVDFKQEVMKYNREKRRDKNGRLLNVLLYLLSFFGCIGTLEILEERFALPFNWGLIIAVIVFGVGGFAWMITEQKD